MAGILFIDMWPDVLPEGQLRDRYRDLPPRAQAHGRTVLPLHFSRVVPTAILADRPQAVVISGSRTNLVDALADDPEDGALLTSFAAVTALLAGLPPATPVLGICFGHQYLAKAAGGRLERMAADREEDDFPLSESQPDPLLAGLGSPPRFVERHLWRVAEPGAGYVVVARSSDGVEMVRHRTLPRVGVQFHPEYFAKQRPASGLPDGRIFLDNWLSSL